MAHKILVLSPLHNMGTTVVSSMLAQGVTYAGKSSTLVFTDKNSYIPKYLGVEGLDDPTRSITQVVELIDNAAIENRDILTYAHTYAKNAFLMNTANPSLSDAFKLQTVQYVYERVTSDVVVCDCSDDIDSTLVSELLELSNMVLIVVKPSLKVIDYMKNWLEYSVLKGNPNIFIVVNEYNETIASLRDFCKALSFPANRVCKLHYNPWIPKCCFNGTLPTILPLTMNLDYRVANIVGDINEINQAILSDILISNKKGF